jgi:hypothetical protein
MLNLDGLPSFGPPLDLPGRILQRLRSEKVNDQVIMVVKNACENALTIEKMVLSRAEKKLLMEKVLKSVFAEINKELDEGRES